MAFSYLYLFLVHLFTYIFLILIPNIFIQLWWAPRRIENHFLRQGIKGPKYRFLLGNLKELSTLNSQALALTLPLYTHDIVPRVLSFYHHWKIIYGSTFLVWFGNTARLVVSDPALVNEILVVKTESFEKIEPPLLVKRMEGDGLLNLKGEKWTYHRKIIHPFFHNQNIKLMLPMMAEIVEEEIVKRWDQLSENGKMEVEALDWFRKVIQHMITRATLGSSYEDGGAIFELQSQYIARAMEAYHKAFIPGYRFLPTIEKITLWRLEKRVRKLLLKLIKDRRMIMKEESNRQLTPELGDRPIDLLWLMITAASEPLPPPPPKQSSSVNLVTKNDIVEECKTLFFAGKETTSSLLTWTTVLLAMYPQWQEVAREEVLRVCGARGTPTREDLANLKVLDMILNETLRLYPPVVATIRRATKDVEVGDIHILEGTELILPIISAHHDPNIWTHDAREFNPSRFASGLGDATAEHQGAFVPFGSGARRCVGQNLAITMAKLVIAIVIRRFYIELAPDYMHAPSVVVMLHPQFGAPLIFSRIQN